MTVDRRLVVLAGVGVAGMLVVVVSVVVLVADRVDDVYPGVTGRRGRTPP